MNLRSDHYHRFRTAHSKADCRVKHTRISPAVWRAATRRQSPAGGEQDRAADLRVVIIASTETHNEGTSTITLNA
jgi:hypothetical protein